MAITPRTETRINHLADEAAATADAETALTLLRELRVEVDELERSRVAEALRDGASFGTIAKAMGISRQAAHRRYRDLAPTAEPEPLQLSSHARRALHLAVQEARRLNARTVGSEHLLLGVLRSGGPTAGALEAEGLTADAVRACVRAAAAPDPEQRVTTTVLKEAATVARARNSPFVEADHVVLAALNAPDGGALRAVTALGAQAAAVRARLGC